MTLINPYYMDPIENLIKGDSSAKPYNVCNLVRERMYKYI